MNRSRIFIVLLALSALVSCRSETELTGWSARIWEENLPVYNAILSQPFIRELANGTLPSDKFSRYLAQDEIYSSGFVRQLVQFTETLPDSEDKAFFMTFSQASIESEEAMHQLLMERYGVDGKGQPSRITSEYGAHTQQALDSGLKEVALAAMLPCLWIYNRAGLDILRIAELDGNPYMEWIMEYGDEEYTAEMDQILKIIDRWAEAAENDVVTKMDEAFLEAARFEYAFWRYCYTGDDRTAFDGL